MRLRNLRPEETADRADFRNDITSTLLRRTLNLKPSRVLAMVCALAVSFSVTGCADTSWAVKNGDITVPAGIYLYYLLQNAYQVESSSASSSSSSSAASGSLLGSASSSSSSSAASDPWAKKIQGVSASVWAMNEALESTKELLVVEQQCAQRKIALTSSEKSSLVTQADSVYSQYTTLFSKNNIAQTSLERLYEDMTLKGKLFDSYYGANGDKAVAAGDIADYYTKNFVQVKQIFVAKIDTSTYQTLSADKLAAAKKKAQEAYAAVQAAPANFDSLRTKYNEDTNGAKEYPDGYIFSKKTAATSNYDQKFVDLAFSLKDGQIGMAESDMGYFIEDKSTTSATASSYSSEKETVLEEMKSDDFTALLKNAAAALKISVNNAMRNKYTPQKMTVS